MKIIIFGATGTGKTTLAKGLSHQFGWHHLDSDDYYWKKTDPPYTHKVPYLDRVQRLCHDFLAQDNVVISGNMVSWGASWIDAFDLGVFLWLPPEIRMKRLREREEKRYQHSLDHDERIKAVSKAFLEWAATYDDETAVNDGINKHRGWITKLKFPILEIKDDTTTTERIMRIASALEMIDIRKKAH
ncbi:MAG: AAA family ATPase [Bacteroidota bacterium]